MTQRNPSNLANKINWEWKQDVPAAGLLYSLVQASPLDTGQISNFYKIVMEG